MVRSVVMTMCHLGGDEAEVTTYVYVGLPGKETETVIRFNSRVKGLSQFNELQTSAWLLEVFRATYGNILREMGEEARESLRVSPVNGTPD